MSDKEINKLIEAYHPKLVELHRQINNLIIERDLLRKQLKIVLNNIGHDYIKTDFGGEHSPDCIKCSILAKIEHIGKRE